MGKSVEELKAQTKKKNKGNTIVDSDYVLRDKEKEDKDPVKKAMNSRDITNEVGKYAEEIARIKAEARAEAKAEGISPDFIEKLKAEITKQVRADIADKTATEAPKAKPTTRTKAGGK